MKKFKILYQILKASNITSLINLFVVTFLICSVGLMIVEPGITSLQDSLWFCFSSVTTIGYGDYPIVTLLGRSITIFISLYGIIIISVFTGAIVSYIGEIQKIKARNSVTNFINTLEDLDKLSPEELKALSQNIKNRKFKI